MSRLIDADELLKELHEAIDGSGYDEDYKCMGIDDFINSQPTAYDVNKVINELEEFEEEARQFNVSGVVADMLEIVRKGGVE